MTVSLALTMGDPGGIGPEICLQSLDAATEAGARAIIVGDAGVLQISAAALGTKLEIPAVADVSSLPGDGHVVLDLDNIDVAAHEFGVVQAEHGRASVEYLRVAVDMCMNGAAEAVVTAPMNKEALMAAGVQEPGHTEMLGALTGTTQYETMFTVGRMKIFFATRHQSLRDAIDSITKEGLLTTLDNARTALQLMGVGEPEIAVAALNPHGGEQGLFGDEEMVHIRPAVEEANGRGWNVVGPVPADSVFAQHKDGRYDAVLSMFHDQGHIASKTLDFNGTVSVTTGLPIIRTSVDHGTAFDIAGGGVADPGNMRSAVLRAVDLVRAIGPRLEEMRTAPAAG